MNVEDVGKVRISIDIKPDWLFYTGLIGTLLAVTGVGVASIKKKFVGELTEVEKKLLGVLTGLGFGMVGFTLLTVGVSGVIGSLTEKGGVE